jgi:hypothetical protein
LSLSAWLPAAALLLLLDFIVQLGVALDARGEGPAWAIGDALTRMSAIGIGGAVLLVIAVVVVTILTQALSFEAIRVLEGYWGTTNAVESIARWRASRHRSRKDKLDRRRRKLTEDAWAVAKAKIIELEDGRRQNGLRPDLTPIMIGRLEARVLKTFPAGRLTPKQLERVRRWRRVNVSKHLNDFPRPERTLPTRLGNILRAHEDQIEHEPVESFIQDVFDELPRSLQKDHDEQRNRLELYCSMVFVVTLSGIVGIVRFTPQHWPYAIGSTTAAAGGIWIMYRAALATARAYGQLLVAIARRTTT